MRRHSLTLLSLLCALSSSVVAQEEESAYNITLDSVTVKGYRYRSPIKTEVSGLTKWNVSDLKLLPQVLGSAEPVRYAQMLPGVQTNNELRSGISIEGCDNQHNLISIEGVPIYNVNHLFGFFSTFNTPHFSSVAIAKGPTGAGSPNRIGGMLEMHHFTTIPDTASGTLSAGLIASQATANIPLSAKTAATVSVRKSYLNLLYSHWLEIDDQQIRYSFNDANLTLLHRLNNRHTLMLDFYSGNDVGTFSEKNFLADMKARWGNNLGAVHWLYDNGDGLTVKATAYITDYRNRFGLDFQEMSFRLPSGITDIGVKCSLVWRDWNVGMETNWYDILPQSLEQNGGFNADDLKESNTQSVELSMYANYEYALTEALKISGGARGSRFTQKNTNYSALDPSVRLIYDKSVLHISATYALRHQYLFQTGFSDAGLPTEFWISADNEIKPQYAHEGSINGGGFFLNGRYKFEAGLFYRKLYHQLAYKGSVLDLANSAYDIGNSLVRGNGVNYGVSLMLNKCTGRLTGWMSYTYTVAQRSFDEENRKKYYPANHERPHELNVVFSYTAGRHWIFSGTAVYASGTPITPIESAYILNNNIVIKYGDFNSTRLKPYFRIDLSANYKWNGKRETEQGVNFSLYNATNRENELFRYLRIREDAIFYYKSVTFIRYALPSFSYYCKF